MMVRLSAAICGAVIIFAVSSAAMARTGFHSVHSSAANSVHSSAATKAASGAAIVGAASMYNPFKPGWREGGPETATGERYDPSAWAAAIKTGLRGKFGGVHHGSKPSYALVEGRGKKVIVKINDVGPLTPGRVIDFDERTMRYFDPSLQLGVIKDVKVTPLPSGHWTPGPIAALTSDPLPLSAAGDQ
jgi:rare lipoprotein A